MSTVDYNVDTYTISELLAILGLDDPSSDQIIDATNRFIFRFSPANENQPHLVNFFQQIQTKLLRYMKQLKTSGKSAEYAPNAEQTNEWYKYEALPQDNQQQMDKLTDRIQKVDIYDNQHVPMKREVLGMSDNYNVPVAQDSLNPNLQNITNRLISIDSQFRPINGGSDSTSTDFTLDLSDPLTNVLSLRLYSIQIPYTWYAIDYLYGNTCFWVTNKNNTFRIFIEPGNYTPTTFCNALQFAFTNPNNFQIPLSDSTWPNAFTYPTTPFPTIATINPNNGKITIKLDGWIDPDGNTITGISQYSEIFDANTNPFFTFFDVSGLKSCYLNGTNPCTANNSAHVISSTLGWLMGFRVPLQPIFALNGNTPISIINLYGTKYFILVIDDFNQNHINNGLVTITELSKTLALPNYYNATEPYICTAPISNYLDDTIIGNLSNISAETATALGQNPNTFAYNLQDKINLGTNAIQTILPSAPRTLTQAQIYTINEIIKNRSKTISFKAKAPTSSDTFAIIPIKYGSLSTGELFSETSGQFQDNNRIYFGPVNIDRLRIKLLDDRGNVIDLHGADWCITLISQNLYQY
jgi:hypothetical protein